VQAGMGRSPMEAKRNGGRGTRPTYGKAVNMRSIRQALRGRCKVLAQLRVRGRSVPQMPPRAMKNRYSKPPECPFFTRSGKIFNRINNLQRYTSYEVSTTCVGGRLD
jgi:hypothetical protein